MTAAALATLLLVTSGAQSLGRYIGVPVADRVTARMLWPQNWSFFATGDVRPLYVGYRTQHGDLVPIARPFASAVNDGGLSRRLDGTYYELNRIGDAVPEAAWRSCGPALADCTALIAQPTATVPGSSTSPRLCGVIVLARIVPVRTGQDVGDVTAAVRVQLRCAA